MASTLWNDAWERAQPSLGVIRENINARSPDPRIVRVGQLDSELLDQELVQLLQDPISKALGLISTSLKSRFEPELTLVIQLMLYKFSIWNIGSSYGAKLQDLRYIVSPGSPKAPLAPSGLPRRTLIIHGALTTLIPYFHSRIRTHALSNSWPDAPSSDRRRKAWEVLTTLESSYTLVGLLSFVAFLWNGRYRTIADRLLQMRLVSSRRLTRREISYEFMNRQMVWHAFTEFLLFILPLVSTRGIRRRINRISSQIAEQITLPSFLGKAPKGIASTPKNRGKYWSLSEDQCAICAEDASFNLNLADPSNAFTSLTAGPSTSTSSSDEPPAHPLNTPYITSCGHLYCYHCIAERLMRAADDADEGRWRCLRCSELVINADRLEGHLKGSETSEEHSDFSFDYSEFGGGSVSNMSGSMNYSDSGGSET